MLLDIGSKSFLIIAFICLIAGRKPLQLVNFMTYLSTYLYIMFMLSSSYEIFWILFSMHPPSSMWLCTLSCINIMGSFCSILFCSLNEELSISQNGKTFRPFFVNTSESSCTMYIRKEEIRFWALRKVCWSMT